MIGSASGKSITVKVPRAVLAAPSQLTASPRSVRVLGFIPL
jgi:hypothetical protein